MLPLLENEYEPFMGLSTDFSADKDRSVSSGEAQAISFLDWLFGAMICLWEPDRPSSPRALKSHDQLPLNKQSDYSHEFVGPVSLDASGERDGFANYFDVYGSSVGINIKVSQQALHHSNEPSPTSIVDALDLRLG
mmetsp:Transcript_29598/g.67008  ORF Transcript_29598/g.67008 Transcript_29598/m.67008 type:complete len:136 (-) Transcript_29598:374-781(-)